MAKKTRKEKLQEQQVQLPDSESKSLPILDRKLVIQVLALSVITTFIAYFSSLFNGFVLWDDPEYVYENPFFKDFKISEVFSLSTYYMGNYHPLTLLWLYWESIIFPSGDPNVFNGYDPFWFHLNNLLLHLLNVVLVFYVVYELLDKKGWKTAGLTAILFGIHPMHVESVAWVSEIKDVLYSAFFLGALLVYIRYLKEKKLSFIVLSFILFVLSNLSKAQAVTLPLLLFLIDYYRGRKFTRNSILEKIPFFAGSLFFGIVAIKAQGAESAINENYYSSFSSLFYGSYGLLIYIYKFFLPINLSGAHPYPTTPLQPLPLYFYGMPLILAAIGFLLYKSLKFSKDYLFGFLFYAISISVMLKLVPVGDTITAERYTYIPYIGLFFVLGQLFDRYSHGNLSKIVQYGTACILILLAVMTWDRTRVWKDSFSFWGDVSEKYPNYWRGYNCVGQEYAKIGDYENALINYTKACELDEWAPPVPYMLRGALYIDNLKNYDLAIADFKKVISFPNKNDPSQLDGRHNLGLAYIRKGDYQSAVKILNEAITLAPQHPKGYYFMGLALAGAKDYRQAEKAYGNAIKVNPNSIGAYLNRGVLYTDKLNEYDKGISDFKKVLTLTPNHLDANINLGICLYKKGLLNEAIQQFNRCLQLSPKSGRIYYLMALVYVKGNNYQLAVDAGTKAKQLGMNIGDNVINGWKSKTN